MNKCPECGKVLVTCKTLFAIEGRLFCRRYCATQTLSKELYKETEDYREAVEAANSICDDHGEYVHMEDVLGEDLQDVQVAVTFFKTVKLPKCLSEERVLEVTEHMWNEGKLLIEPGHCDDVSFACELVKNDNSSCNEVDTNE